MIRLKRAIPVDPSSISLLEPPETDLSDFEFEGDDKGCGNWFKQRLSGMRKPGQLCKGCWKSVKLRFRNFYIDTFLVPSYRAEWGKYKAWSYLSPLRSSESRCKNKKRTSLKLKNLETDEQRYRRSTLKSIDLGLVSLLKNKAAQENTHLCHNHAECQRVRINVGGSIYETQLKTLNRYPDTLLGNPVRRMKYYNPRTQEYFFDRNRASFETILYFYQSGGRFRKPENMAADIILDDAKFYGLPESVIYQFLLDEGLTYATQPDDVLPANLFMRKIWLLFDEPESSLQARIVAIMSVVSIVLNITTFCLETENILAARDDRDIANITGVATQSPFNPPWDPFFMVESICSAWFSLEYLARLSASPSKSDFITHPLNIIDFIAIVPYFFTLANTGPQSDESGGGYKKSAVISFSTIRVVRLVRVFRIFKLSRHSKGLKILGKTLQASLNELMLLIMFVLMGVILFSSAMYFAEMDTLNNRFPSIPDGFWWAVITITTIGYGDIVPETTLGKVVGALCAVAGVLTIALPVPVIVSNFNFFYNQAIVEQDLSWLKISHVPSCPYRCLDGGDPPNHDDFLMEKMYSSDEEFGELKDRALVRQGINPEKRGGRRRISDELDLEYALAHLD